MLCWAPTPISGTVVEAEVADVGAVEGIAVEVEGEDISLLLDFPATAAAVFELEVVGKV